MDCSMPGFLVLHYLLELAQTHVHWIVDAIQPSRTLSSSSSPAFSLSQHHGLSQRVSCLHHVAKVLELRFSISPSNDYSGLISFRIDWFNLLAFQGTLESSPAPQFESISSSVLSLLYGLTLTTIHDYWEDDSLYYIPLSAK